MAILGRLRIRDNKVTAAAELTLRQSIFPLALVTILFFLWGFSYGLIDTLNKHFQETLGITRSRSSGLQAAYFGAYPLASLGHANWLLRHYGYKATFIWGLCLYGIGSLLTWPCLVYRSFGGFCAATFIIGNGLGSLETAANPYLAVCGPPKYSEIRINIAQAFNGVGTVVAPVLGSYVFFRNTGYDNSSLKNVQWVYLAIACFVFALAVVYYFSPIPEITDADMAFQMESIQHAETNQKPFRKQYRLFHATVAQFCSTGAQIAIAGAFINYITEIRVINGNRTSSSDAARLLAGAQGLFTAGRFMGSAAMKFTTPRWVFFFFATACMIFMIPLITERGNIAVGMIYMVLFFESIIFPTTVALGMRGLGKHSKRGSGLIVAGVAGGAVVPPLLFVASDAQGKPDYRHHAPTATAMAVPLAFFVTAWTYSFCVNFVPAYRNVADSILVTEENNVDSGQVDSDSLNADQQVPLEHIKNERAVHVEVA